MYCTRFVHKIIAISKHLKTSNQQT